jgi:hypothetical protein
MEVEKFVHEGLEFEIRKVATDLGISIKSFYKDVPLGTYFLHYGASGPSHALSIRIEMAKYDIQRDAFPALKAIRRGATSSKK